MEGEGEGRCQHEIGFPVLLEIDAIMGFFWGGGASISCSQILSFPALWGQLKLSSSLFKP